MKLVVTRTWIGIVVVAFGLTELTMAYPKRAMVISRRLDLLRSPLILVTTEVCARFNDLPILRAVETLLWD
jgi:hypothetical protein